jgi:MoaA/NifB/PqqE/SkfB family radical SAM enzyme
MSDVQLFEGQTGAEEIWSSKLKFVWLEITGKCNLRCTHCYADSVPEGAHSALSRDEWQSIITDAQEMGAETIQFIGGEPTLHPDFSDLVRFVANSGLKIEVFTNLLHVPSSMWTLFEECQVSLATSFYSSDSTIHDRVTTRVGSQRRMLATIQDALRRSLPLRVGLINVLPEQHVTETEAMLRSIGVSNITVDTVRGIGRGVSHNRVYLD